MIQLTITKDQFKRSVPGSVCDCLIATALGDKFINKGLIKIRPSTKPIVDHGFMAFIPKEGFIEYVN